MSQQQTTTRPTDPTTRNYTELTAAYDHFNRELFEGRLPPCLITMQRKNKALGYLRAERRLSRRQR